MLKIEPRPQASHTMQIASPLLAVILTVLSGFILFAALDKDPIRAMLLIFIEPLTSVYSVTELLIKASPLMLIASGLALCFRAGVWNIGAEGQFSMGALAGGAVALALYEVEGLWVLPVVCLAGALGGLAWASIPALLRTRFHTNEILVSLMMVYVANLLLSYLVHGPLRDPDGQNFPESRLFHDSAVLPILVENTRLHVGILISLFAAVVAWVLLHRHRLGFEIRVLGQSPRAARFAGFSETRIVWVCLLISGALAGLAGVFEAAGPVGQLVPALPVGYGFTAIIVAFLGRLSPIGVVLAALLLALTYIGGETAQIAMNLPSATTQVFQGLLLFYLLAADLLIKYRVRWQSGTTGHTDQAPQRPVEG